MKLAAPVLCVLLFSCGTRSPVVPDASIPDLPPPPPPISSCGSPACTDFVFSQHKLPASSAEAVQWGFDLAGRGAKNNALGLVLGLLQTQLGFDFESAFDTQVNLGNAPMLLKIKGGLFNDTATVAQSWLGSQAQCCPDSGVPFDPIACATESKTTCFSGGHSFATEPPDDMTLSGSVSSGKLFLSAPMSRIFLPLGGGPPIALNVYRFRIAGTIDPHTLTITDGSYGGVIAKTEFDSKVLPRFVAIFNNEIAQNPNGARARTLLNLLDDNSNGEITAMELTSSPLSGAFVRGDVDLGFDDGVSFGFGFEAVSATILPPN